MVRVNPRAGDIYDPKSEQLRAQRQAIYESCVKQALGIASDLDFRDRNGHRLDLYLDPDTRSELIRRCAFVIGTGVQQRDQRLVGGTQTPTRQAAKESRRRYSDVDRLIRNRQDYEETLGLARQDSFYRVVPEMTQAGVKYFIWPMRYGEHAPLAFSSYQEAKAEVTRRNRHDDPRLTRRWWIPTSKTYRQTELQYWLPPDDVWK